MAEVLFASLSSPKLKISMKEGKVRFDQGVLRLDDENEQHQKWIEELRHSIKNRPTISQLVREINKDKGEEVVRAHQQQMQSMNKAFGGALSSAQLSQTKLSTEMAHLANNPDPEAAKALAAAIQTGDLTPTTDGSKEVVRNNELDTAGGAPPEGQQKNPLAGMLKK
jgi:hypothetical protein